MSAIDFFSRLDTKLAQAAEAKATTDDKAVQGDLFLQTVISRLTPVVALYKAQLRDRKIRAEMDCHNRSIRLTMYYVDGGHRSLSIGGTGETYRIEIRGSFTDGGKDFQSTDGISYDATTWQDSIYLSKLEACIDDFVTYASRHGGTQSA